MAKGARKKTKWVSLSLASATATTDPPAVADNEADEKLKSASRGRKTYTAVVSSDGTRNYLTVDGSNSHYDSAPKEDAGEHGANVSINRERLNDEERGHSPHSNGRLPYSHRNHMRFPKNHFSSHNSHYHNSSSNANGKSHYSHHNGGGSYSNRTSAHSTHYTAEAKNEQNETITINEEEYTKITTPRQDVLFKKGYLSRPKRRTTTATDSSVLSSSANGGTPIDGSDTATGSGSVSTAESVMSDSTYLTEGHFLEYPTPYFGYFDQSGVLVMNGFAIDNNGFSYMNGGQTYIYPPNYNCQASTVFDQEEPADLEHVDELHACNQTQMPDMVNTEDNPVESAINQPAADAADNVDSSMLFPDSTASYPATEESAHPAYEQAGAICDDAVAAEQQQTVEEVEEILPAGADMEQFVPQQPILSPYVNAYDYAQFYNAYYYPGCVMAPFPVAEDVYYNQVGFLSEEEYAKQFSFKKRKKWNRGWEEYYMEVPVDVPPEEVAFAEPHEFVASEVPTEDTASQINHQTQALSNQSPNVEDISNIPSPSAAKPTTTPTSRAAQSLDSIRSQPPKPASVPSQGGRKLQKSQNRKKDLIESTLAFAEQNIDLTKTGSVNAQQAESANVWRTVRHGKEIVDEDRELRHIDTRTMTKMEAIREEISEASSGENVLCLTPQPLEEPTLCGSANFATKQAKKDERISKKGKKTAKSKGKKPKRGNLGQQQTGFEVIEPEFVVSVSKYEKVIEDVDEDEDEDLPKASPLEEREAHQDDVEDMPEKLETSSLEQDDSQQESCPLEENTNVLEDPVEFPAELLENQTDNGALLMLESTLKDVQNDDPPHASEVCDMLINNIQYNLNLESVDISTGTDFATTNESTCYEGLKQDNREQCDILLTDVVSIEKTEAASKSEPKLNGCLEKLADNNDLSEEFPVAQISDGCLTPQSSKRDSHCSENKSEEDSECKHFSEKEYSEAYDSGVQSPAACTVSTVSFGGEERKSSASSSYADNDSNNLTEAVTSWLSETLRSKRLDEMFILPEDPNLLGRIHQFAVTSFDDILALSSDTFSSSGEDAEDADSDYMSDVQVRNRRIDNQQAQGHNNRKTENENDENFLDKQTANGHLHHHGANGDGHSNPKQKRCIIM
ncbi:uncharacterized protein LOC128734805 isoform X2 [Sabethes cyaneus]|uniref:uncharacterized protein LOC128734805 isoform X2 n=1 Tax=Sabethes cyaneus TaxID=53552 RepID=UPI00237D94B4|nr:uncharacterized protein LOC128734805 isoform X2 [Sabethes cyaneus]